jgi:hypothetical protein
MKVALKDAVKRWKEAWKMVHFRVQLICGVSILLLLAVSIGTFFNYIQSRTGVIIIEDPIVSRLPARNVSVYIFGFIYSALISSIVYLVQYPMLLARGILAYGVLVIARICTIYWVPLEPPLSIIPLIDPFVDNLFYVDTVITKDLFFSGHVSILFLIYLITPHKVLKFFYILATFTVAILLLFQHVHYTIDIIGGLLFAWISVRISALWNILGSNSERGI